jgi:3-oxoacyl-[acyl-carrier protein] reductase
MSESKIALITGANKGIGLETARQLGKQGIAVLIGARDAAKGEQAAKTLQAEGISAEPIVIDVANRASVDAAAKLVEQKYGKLDILVNNAGIAKDGLVMRFSEEDWDRTLDVNLKGAWALTKAVSRPMMKAKSGSIINLTSVVGEMGNGGQAAYASSKAGLIGFTKSVAKELASRNIRVNAVSPGFIDTDMTSAIPEASRTKMLEAIPLSRLGNSQEIADSVLFLASDRSSYITGQVLRVNGGMYV